ncbi:MAG: glycerol-3-phosphate 1-O-acyltransferase PlsY [Alphaproteobacteria bacterium]|nr:glycerol-3-phosphate 1-O-acyltransferase PlsY [Alphaproteobacteria bacterium]
MSYPPVPPSILEFNDVFISLLWSLAYILALYLIGSIPFGLLLTKIAGYGDIRKIGSGNVGATNVLRTGNKGLAALTLLLDAGKGAVLVFYFFGFSLFSLPDFSGPDHLLSADSSYMLALIIGFIAVLGHCFPVWLKFKGGKGVATALGVLLAAVPYTGLAACGVWLATAYLFRISSLAALVAIGTAPVVTYFIYGGMPSLICLTIAVLVFIRHTANIQRLLKGEEPRIGAKK